jgi:Cof subfamily protein (haloacid dehalogenase superfamily)
VATDLDGTLLHSDGTVSDRARTALAAVEDAGALVVFVTGRPPRWMPPVVEQTGHRGIAVCANGALVYDLHTERVIEEHLMQPEIAAELVHALRAELPGLVFAVERGDRGFAHEPAYTPAWTAGHMSVGDVEEIISEPMAKLLGRHPDLDADALLERAQSIVGELATLTHSSRDGLLEVSAAGVSKASTLELLCREHGHQAADVVAFGDMPNDLPMLTWAGTSYAMANAHASVLAATTRVAPSNDEDGVAQVIEQLLDTHLGLPGG